MNGLEIQNILLNDEDIVKLYCGVKAANEMDTISNKIKCLYIVNTQPRYFPGLHWVVIYCNNTLCEFFDSFGNPPSFYGTFFNDFVNKYDICLYSKMKVQQFGSDSCGLFCIYFCYYKSRGYTYNEIMKQFSNDKDVNEFIVKQLVDKLRKY